MASTLRINALLDSGLGFREGLGWTTAVGHAHAPHVSERGHNPSSLFCVKGSFE